MKHFICFPTFFKALCRTYVTSSGQWALGRSDVSFLGLNRKVSVQPARCPFSAVTTKRTSCWDCEATDLNFLDGWLTTWKTVARRSCIDVCMRERENIVTLAYCKFGMRVKLPRIENEKFKKVYERHKLWLALPLRCPMVTRETVKMFGD